MGSTRRLPYIAGPDGGDIPLEYLTMTYNADQQLTALDSVL